MYSSVFMLGVNLFLSRIQTDHRTLRRTLYSLSIFYTIIYIQYIYLQIHLIIYLQKLIKHL